MVGLGGVKGHFMIPHVIASDDESDPDGQYEDDDNEEEDDEDDEDEDYGSE